MRYVSFFVFVVVSFLTSFAHAAPGHSSLYFIVQEALPQDITKTEFALIKGVNRTKEPVTFGVPYALDSAVPETSQLLLLDNGLPVSDVQYQPLQRWKTNTIKWLRVDLQTTLKANGQKDNYLLSKGTPIPTEGKLAKEEGDMLVVNTGAATFWISKTAFNLIDKAQVADKVIIEPGTSQGIVITDKDDKQYTSALDKKPSVSIETNGPIRAVIWVRGTHTAKDGSTFLKYTVRMHFYKGKSRVRLLYTLQNASKHRLENVQFKSVELLFKSSLAKSLFRVRHHDGESTGQLDKEDGKVRLFQGENNYPTIREKGFEKAVWPTHIEGYQLTHDGKELQKGDRTQPVKWMYGQLEQKDGPGLMVGTRFGTGNWPQGLGLDGDGTLRIGVFPVGNDRLYTLRFGSHKTSEHVVYVQETAADPRDEFLRFQYPLVGRPKIPAWYNADGMLLWRLMSFKQEADYYQQRGLPFEGKPLTTLARRPSFAVIRHLDRTQNIQDRNLSRGLIQYLNFLRQEDTTAGTYYLMAEQFFRYDADQSIHRSDDYDNQAPLKEVPQLDDGKGGIKTYKDLPNADKLPSTSSLWQPHNSHAYGIAFWAFTGANARMTRAVYDWAETSKRWATNNPDTRTLAWNIFNLAEIGQFSTLPEYKDAAWKLITEYLLDKTPKAGESGGWDRNRGYFVGPAQAKEADPTLNTSVMSGTLARALYLFGNYVSQQEYNKPDNDQTDRVRDVIEGLARYTLEELWVKQGETPGSYGVLSSSQPTKAPLTPKTDKNWQGGLQDAFGILAYGYLITREEAFLDALKWMLQSAAHNPANQSWFQDRPERHLVQDIIENPTTYYFWRPLTIKIEKASDGKSATLTWKKPGCAINYWVKYADKTIVPSLGYNPSTKKYKHDPTTHIPFFGARNIANEPAPGDASPNEEQRVVIKGLDPGKTYHFAARYNSYEDCEKRNAQPPTPTEGTNQNDGGDTSDQPVDPPVCGCHHPHAPWSPALFVLFLGLFFAWLHTTRRGGKHVR